MTKLVTTATGKQLDWDLMKIQASIRQNIDAPLVISTDSKPVQETATEIATRRDRRRKLEAAKQTLAAIEERALNSNNASSVDNEDNGWAN